jgi:hypothetical protein
MSRIVVVILIYHCHRPIDLIHGHLCEKHGSNNETLAEKQCQTLADSFMKAKLLILTQNGSHHIHMAHIDTHIKPLVFRWLHING